MAFRISPNPQPRSDSDREAILFPWNKIDFVWISDNADLKVHPASRKRCLIVHPTPRTGA